MKAVVVVVVFVVVELFGGASGICGTWVAPSQNTYNLSSLNRAISSPYQYTVGSSQSKTYYWNLCDNLQSPYPPQVDTLYAAANMIQVALYTSAPIGQLPANMAEISGGISFSFSTNYDQCPNYLYRSTTVNVMCSDEESIDSITETSMCRYLILMNSPAGCSGCKLGTISPSCTPCPAGTSNGQPNQDTCTPCPVGTYSQTTGSTSCSLCPAGTFNNKPGQTQCELCPPGSFNSKSNQTACVLCSKGQYQLNSGATSCSQCPINTYSTNDGTVACPLCEVGTYSGIGADSCQPCGLGLEGINPGEGCVQCQPGFYKDVISTAKCTGCPVGYFSTQRGASSEQLCAQCPIATSTNGKSGSTTCPFCAPGTYGTDKGRANCIDCPEGTYTNINGSKSCDVCLSNTYAKSGSAICTPCPNNMHSSSGAKACNLDAGPVAGIIVGSIVGAVLIGGGAWFLYKKKKSKVEYSAVRDNEVY